jgi:hypothetical protein
MMRTSYIIMMRTSYIIMMKNEGKRVHIPPDEKTGGHAV